MNARLATPQLHAQYFQGFSQVSI